jgi:hypothetical protein
MIEIWSRELTAAELLGAVEAFRRAPGFRENRDDESVIEFDWTEPKSLKAFRLVPGTRVELAHEAGAEKLEDFCALARGGIPPGTKRLAMLTLEFAESGKSYDPRQVSDLTWMYSLSAASGLGIMFWIGEASRGHASIPERLDVFEGAMRLLGVGDDLTLSMPDGKLRIAATGGRIEIWRPPAAHPEPPFVDLTGSELDGTNFIGMGFHGLFPLDALSKMASSTAAAYGLPRLRAAELDFSCEPDDYDSVCRHIAGAKLKWRVRLQAENPFELRDLGRAIDSTSEFNFHAFTIRPKKLGRIDVDLSGEDGRYRMRFVPASSDPTVEERAAPVLEEIGGLGSDFLEREA